MIANEKVIDRVKKVHDFLTVGAAAPLMEAATVGLNFGDEYYHDLKKHYSHMRDLFLYGLKNRPYLHRATGVLCLSRYK